MQIYTNEQSLFTARQLTVNATALQKSMQRLSSGLRIYSAADDAAGLSIFERFTTQIRGLNQAVRNAQDGLSMLQTAEGSLVTVAESLQRIRELSVQAANSTNSDSDRAALQQEASQLVQEVERIGRTTQFNDEDIFATISTSVVGDINQLAVVDGLQSGWLNRSEQLVSDFYGFSGDGAGMGIEFTTFTDGAGGTAARVTGAVGASGKANDVKLQIDMADFTPPNLPNGGTAPFYNDRIIAHEMVHAVMYRSVNVGSMFTNNEEWFMEGTAEFIHGADERLVADIAANGGGVAGANAIAAVGSTFGVAWGGASIDYSAAYAATRFLHEAVQNNGGTGIRDVTQYMTNNIAQNLETAITANTGYATIAAFYTDFQTNGSAFIQGFDLANADTGAVGGLDADGGPVRTAESVIESFSISSGEDQLTGFNENWEQVAAGSSPQNIKTMQVGANVGEVIAVDIGAINANALDIADVDLVNNFNQAIFKMDRALDYVNAQLWEGR